MLSGYIFATKAHIDNRKKVKQQYLLHMSSQYGELRPTNGSDRLASLGHPQQISTSFAFWLRHCTNVAQRRSTKLCMVFGRFLGWYIIYTFLHFWGSYPVMEFCQVQNSLCDKVLRSPILAVLLHNTRAVGVSQTLWHGTRNGITELLLLVISTEGAIYIPMAVITLGIGPHSSFRLNSIDIKRWAGIFTQ